MRVKQDRRVSGYNIAKELNICYEIFKKTRCKKKILVFECHTNWRELIYSIVFNLTEIQQNRAISKAIDHHDQK